MIVRMKKVTLFTSINERDKGLKTLRNMGILHIKSDKVSSDDTSILEEHIARTEQALDLIGSDTKGEIREKNLEEVTQDILDLGEEQEELLLEKEELETKLAVFRKWDNVSLESIRQLSASGVYVKLYSENKGNYRNEDTLRDDLYKVGTYGDDVLLAHISREDDAILEFQAEHLPKETRRKLRDRLYTVEERLAVLNSKLKFLGNYENILREYKGKLTDELHYAEVKAEMKTDGEICYLQGFIPVDKAEQVRSAAAGHSWAYLIEDVTEDDAPPTLIRNPRWVSIIYPVFKFLGTVPGYNEHDISISFLIFFSLFFAMLIGDAGYGAIFMIATMIAQRKMKSAPPQPFILMYVLCAGTILWGIITGTYFGSSALGANPFLRQFVIKKIASFDSSGVLSSSKASTELMMGICFIIGGVHLTIAHLSAAWKKINSLECLSDFGWILIIWGLYFLVKTLIFKAPFPDIASYMIGAGTLAALLFSNCRFGIVKGLKDTVVQLPLSLISGFSDIVSYMRLFAVGYTAVVLANNFNEMGAGASKTSMLLGGLILVLGHILNITLSVMGVVVHGIRLKMLEFSGHIGNEWTGREYSPFRKPEHT